MACCSIHSIAEASLSSFLHLTHLDLKGMRGGITTADAAALTIMPRLQSLILAFCEQVHFEMANTPKLLAERTLKHDQDLTLTFQHQSMLLSEMIDPIRECIQHNASCLP